MRGEAKGGSGGEEEEGRCEDGVRGARGERVSGKEGKEKEGMEKGKVERSRESSWELGRDKQGWRDWED